MADLDPTEEQLADFWHGQGMSNAGVAGILGTASQEAPQGPDSYNNDSGASGTYQYLGSRARGEMQYAQASGRDPWDPQAQNEYAAREMRGEAPGSGLAAGFGDSMFNANDPAAAADNMVRGFERPGAATEGESRRAQVRAQGYLPTLDARYGSGGGTTLRGIAGERADEISAAVGIPADAPMDLADPETRQALKENGIDADQFRPVPAPQPKDTNQPRKSLGPYRSSYDAYSAAPADRQNYTLVQSGDGWSWHPGNPQLPADRNPLLPSPHIDNTVQDQAAASATINSPQTYGPQIANGVTNIGRGFNGALAHLLDLPAWAADKALGAIAAGTGTKPITHFGHPAEDMMNRLGFETSPKGDDGWANAGAAIGSGMGMALPMVVTGGLAAGGAFGEGMTANALARGTGFGNGVTTGTAANELAMGGAAGLGQEEGHEFYQSQTGRSGDLGDYASQILGGGIFNAVRIPLFAAGEKVAGTAVGQAWQGAKAAKVALKGDDAAAPQALDATTGKQVTDETLSQQLGQYLDHADQTVAALHTADPADSANYLAERSQAARAAVQQFAKNSRAEEGTMWNEVNTQIPMDFSATRQLYAAERANHFNGTLRDTKDFPTWLDPLLGRSGAGQAATGVLDANGQPIIRNGLQDIDTLGRGRDIMSRLGQAIDDEKAAVGRAQNPAMIGYLTRIRNSLRNDMENTVGGVNQDEIDAYHRAMAFSKSRAQIMESDPMSQFLSQRVGDASALSKFLRQGPAGADAVKTLVSAAQEKYGSAGLLGAAKDAVRQMYTDAVAPNGFVSVGAHKQFMKNYGAVLNDPAFADVKQQLTAAGEAASNIQDIQGFSKPGGFGVSQGALDARQAASDAYLEAPTETVVRHLEAVTNPIHATSRVLNQLAQDPAGRASLGFQHVIAQEALDNPGWAAKNPGIVKAIDNINPGFADRMAKYTSSTTKAGILGQLYDMATSYVGAHFGGNLAEHAGSSFVLAGRGASITRQMGQNLKNAVTKISSANIVDAGADAAWDRLNTNGGGKLYTAGQRVADMTLMHSYVPGLALGNAMTGPSEGPGQATQHPGGVTLGPTGQPWWRDTTPALAPARTQSGSPASAGAAQGSRAPASPPMPANAWWLQAPTASQPPSQATPAPR